MNNTYFVFVYKKDDIIACFTYEEAIEKHDSMIRAGYEHIETLDACRWIQYQYNSNLNGE